MHQWWGDNVTEGGYAMTFYKEGIAQLAQYMLTARNAETAAGGPGTAAGQAAFQASLDRAVQHELRAGRQLLVGGAVEPDAVRAVLQQRDLPAARHGLHRAVADPRHRPVHQGPERRSSGTYGGGSITEPQLEAAFQRGLPNKSAACRSQLGQFFTEWFDTAYPSGTTTEPDITGPGLAGPGFYGTQGGECKNV